MFLSLATSSKINITLYIVSSNNCSIRFHDCVRKKSNSLVMPTYWKHSNICSSSLLELLCDYITLLLKTSSSELCLFSNMTYYLIGLDLQFIKTIYCRCSLPPTRLMRYERTLLHRICWEEEVCSDPLSYFFLFNLPGQREMRG